MRAQSYIANMEHLDIYEGLSNHFVTNIIQDDRGILWIGTKDGLNRYDGFKFTSLTPRNSALRLGAIGFMHFGPDGRIYIYTCRVQRPGLLADVQCLDPESLNFYEVDPALAGMVDSTFTNRLMYTDGVLYSSNGFAYSFNEKKVSPMRMPADFFWQWTIFHFAYDINIPGQVVDLLKPDHVMAADQTHDPVMTRFWKAVTSGTISYLYADNLQYDDHRDLLWVEQPDGLVAIASNGQRIEFADSSLILKFPRAITSIVTGDRLYVGTESGIYIMSLEKVRFRNYFFKKEYSGLLNESGNRAILVDHDTIYTCLDNGFFRCPVTHPDQVELISRQKRPRNLVYLNKDEILIGGGGVQLYNLRQGQMRDILAFPEEIKNTWGLAVFHDTIYASNTDGLFYAPLRTESSRQFESSLVRLIPEGQNQVYQFVPLDSNHIFLVSAIGLFTSRNDLTDLHQVSFAHRDGRPGTFSHCTYLMRDGKGEYWMTSEDGGLVHFALKDTTALILHQLDKEDGVETNTFYAVYPDQLGSFWCSTDLGIVQLDTADWSFQTYSEPDGMRNKEFNRLSHYMDVNGDIYFGGLDGVTAFSPRDFYSVNEKPLRLNLLNIEQYSGWERAIVNKTQSFSESNQIRLAPGDNFFVLEVGLNDLYQTSQQQYAYRIAGLDTTWLDIQGNRLRIYGLPYGKHLIEVQGRNARGIAAENTLMIPVYVLRPIYLRWWFILFAGLGLILIIREYYVARTRRMQSEARKLEGLVRERTTTIAKQAEELREIGKARSRFFANISHELRTPLTLIKGPIQSLLHGDKPKDREKEYLKIIAYNSHLLGERIEDLLTLAKSESGQLELRKTAFHLNRFLERLVDSFSGHAAERNFTLQLQNHLPANAVILADGRKLEHVLSNFLTNALKYADQGTRILVTAEQQQDQLLFSVSDQGPGIPAEVVDKIFDRFFVGQRPESGSGIGLALSKELANVMNGTIGVKSAEGQGSTFYVSIPLELTDEELTEKETEDVPIRPASPPVTHDGEIFAPKILCVEDNRSMRDFLLSELQDYQVAACENGLQAIERLEEMSKNASLPDIIVSDIMMPDMDGFALAQYIRSTVKFSAIPIILLTARAGHEDKLHGLRIGVDDYITKPFDVEELRVRIHNLTGRKPMKEEAIKADGESISSVDEKWLKAVEDRIRLRLHERDFTLDDLADDFHMSRSQLYRRIKAFTGLTPHKYLREVRLYKAKELLESGEAGTIAQLSAAVGFEDASYFSRIYAERFGYRPGERL